MKPWCLVYIKKNDPAVEKSKIEYYIKLLHYWTVYSILSDVQYIVSKWVGSVVTVICYTQEIHVGLIFTCLLRVEVTAIRQ